MNYKLSIEGITSDNLESLTRLTLQLWPDCVFEEELANYERIVGSTTETAFVARNETGDCIGFITLSVRRDYVEGTKSTPVGYLEGIWVDPAYRHQGLGGKLVEIGEGWCRQRGCREMASDAELHNLDSQSFHKRIGFAEVNRIVCYRKDLGQ